MINICFITDSNYVLPAMTAIKSLIINNKNEDLCISVIGAGLTEKEQSAIKKLNTKNAKVEILAVSEALQDIATAHPYVSQTALYKFYIPQIFKELDKILYLDDDILVKGSVRELYDTDISDKYAAVVEDMGAELEGFGAKLGLKKYFNSGMLLLNLKKLREDNITAKLTEYKKNTPKDYFMDQNALNKIFGENVIYLSPAYNYMKILDGKPADSVAKFYNLDKTSLSTISQNPVILHISGEQKPWNTCNAGCFGDFIYYLLRLPASNIKKQAIIKSLTDLTKTKTKDTIQNILERLIDFVPANTYMNLVKKYKNSQISQNVNIVLEQNYILIKIFGKYRKLNRSKKI